MYGAVMVEELCISSGSVVTQIQLVSTNIRSRVGFVEPRLEKSDLNFFVCRDRHRGCFSLSLSLSLSLSRQGEVR